MNMRDPELHDVERFYARQRREILARIAPSRSHLAGRRVGWMAAAAMLALAALGLALLPLPGAQTGASTENLVSETISLPLSAFGTWSENEMLQENDSELDSIEWLMEDSTSLAGTDAFPEFLEAFGTWTITDHEMTKEITS